MAIVYGSFYSVYYKSSSRSNTALLMDTVNLYFELYAKETRTQVPRTQATWPYNSASAPRPITFPTLPYTPPAELALVGAMLDAALDSANLIGSGPTGTT